MFITYWAAKGGAGTTVVAAAHALVSGAAAPTVLVDLDGDAGRVLGVDTDDRPGVAEWLAAGDEAPPDAIDRLLVPVSDGLRLLPHGRTPLGDTDRGATLAHLLVNAPRNVIVDAGTRPRGLAATLVRASDRSVLVTRSCYLALRRASAFELAPSEVVLIREPQRALRTSDVGDALGVPVRTCIPVDPAVARAVDAGLLASRLPRALTRRLGTSAA